MEKQKPSTKTKLTKYILALKGVGGKKEISLR